MCVCVCVCVCVCIIPAGGAIAPTQADATWREVLCLRKMTSAVWGMTQHMDPGGCFFRSLPSVHSSSLLTEPRVGGCKLSFVC